MYKKIVENKKKILSVLLLICFILTTISYIPIVGSTDQYNDMDEWYRPVDQSIFSSNHQNRHDCAVLVNSSWEYPYYIVISTDHSEEYFEVWKTQTWNYSSSEWTLVNANYNIFDNSAPYDEPYELDDIIQKDGIYYAYEDSEVWSYDGGINGLLDGGDGAWSQVGTFPGTPRVCADIGVWYDDPADGGDGLVHIFGEHGTFNHPATTDGSELSHYTSKTGYDNWVLVDDNAVEPNPGVPDGAGTYGVGDATITKINNRYYLACDRESVGHPYNITMWYSDDINGSFTYIGQPITCRWQYTDDWDNYRVQDGDFVEFHDGSGYAMMMNWKDTDGTPYAWADSRQIGSFISTFSGITDAPQFLEINSVSCGSTIYDGTPTINWTIVSGASQYQLQIDNDSDYSSPLINLTDVNQWVYPVACDINATRVSFTIPNSMRLDKDYYYMRVRAYT